MNIFKLVGEVAVNGTDQVRSELNGLSDTGQKVSAKMGTVCTKIGQGLVTMAKVGVTAITATAAGIATLTKSAVQSYSEYEQLVGGVETLFKDSSKAIVEYANNAYKTAGMSANAYMGTVTSFSASLLQGLEGDTAKAVEIANMAIVDMSDNANKMGTDISMIQNAYQGFAKQNYTMLDNLKLGYGGTASEMARLINDSGVLGDTMTVTANTVNQVSFDKIIQAIHIMQDEIGIAGATAAEAEGTIQGSLMSMKAAWSNLITGMADPKQNFAELINNMITSAVTVMDNIAPVIIQALPKVVEGITQLVKSVVPYIPTLLGELIPVAVDALKMLITGMVEELPSILETLFGSTGKRIGTLIQKTFKSLGSIMQKVMPLIENLAVTILPPLLDMIEELLPMFTDIIDAILPVLIEFITALMPPLMDIIGVVLPMLINLLKPILDLVSPLLQILQPIVVVLLEMLKPLLDLINFILPPLIELFSAYHKQMMDSFLPIMQDIANFMKDDFNKRLEAVKPILDVLKEAFLSAANAIKGHFEPLANFFSGVWQGIKNAFGNVADWFGNTFYKAWEKVKNVFSTGGKIFDGIKEGISKVFTTVVNGLITGINKVISVPFNTINGLLNKVRNINILGVSPFKNSWAENPLAIPEIPKLAKGTVVSKATTAVIGEDGPEAVIPLERNTQWIDRVASRFVDKIGNIKTNDTKLIAKLDELIAAIKALKVYLDGDVLVGELAPAFNTALGEIATANERGQ